MFGSMTGVTALAENAGTEADASVYTAAEETEQNVTAEETVGDDVSEEAVQSEQDEPAEEIAEENEQDGDFDISLLAATSSLGGDLTYTLESGTLTIKGTGDMTFTGSKAPWYDQKHTIKKVVIEDGVTSIANDAFHGGISDDYDMLTSVELPDTLTSIGELAFCNCTALTSVEIPASVTTIGEGVFKDCTKLQTVTIPSGSALAGISEQAFYGCEALQGIEIPDSVTAIGPQAFNFCDNLETLKMSQKVTSIGDKAFQDCLKLRAAVLPDGLKTIGARAFQECSALQYIKIPGTVESIGEYAFASCSNITYAVIDEGVMSLSNNMFYNDRAMTNITLPKTLESVARDAFNGCSTLENVYYTGTKTQWGTITIVDDGNTALTDAAIRYNTIRDGDLRYYFIGASDDILKADCLTAAANTIGTEELKNNAKIKAVLIPARVTAIGDNVFEGCNNIEKVYYTAGEDGWQEVNKGTGNEALTNAVLFPNAQQSGDNVIYRYTDADSKNLLISGCGLMPEYTASNSLWRNNTTVETVKFEDRLTSVGSNTFNGCTSIKSVDLSDGTTVIGASAFYSCSGMSEITIPAGVTEIKENAFGNCTSLNEICYMGTAAQWRQLMSNTAAGNDILSANGVDIHYNVKRLGDLKWWIAEGDILEIAGSGNIPDFTDEAPAPWGTDIKGVIIPSTVKGIGNNAFADCENLTKVYYKADGVSYEDLSKGEGNDALASSTVYYNAVREGNIVWTYSADRDAVLTISGAGAIKDYTGKNYQNKDYTPSWSKHAAEAKKVVIEDTVTTVGTASFKGFTALTDLALPDGMKEIHTSAFEGCTSLTNAALPSTVEHIAENAFKNTAIPALTIPEGMESISSGAFEGCTKLVDIKLPATLTQIDANAFKGCTALLSLVIPDTVAVIGDEAFAECKSLQKVNIPDSAATIGTAAFKNCGALMKIILPAGVENLAADVFSGCKSLEKVIVPENTRGIGNNVFAGCDALKYVYYLSTESNWGHITKGEGNSALTNATQYFDCKREKGVIYLLDEESGVLDIVAGSEIGEYTEEAPAPWKNENITKLKLPPEITKIGANAFAGCDKLTDVYYSGTDGEWEGVAVDDTVIQNASVHCNYVITDSDTYEIQDITPTETGVNITVNTNQTVSGEQTVLVASYDENGRFIGLKQTEITSSSEPQNISVDIDKENASTIKAFIWNDAEYMLPASTAQSCIVN